CGGRRCHRRLLRLMRQTTLPRHLATPKAKLMARVGEEFPVACPWVWWRHPADRVQGHDDRAIFQASPDELPDIDIHIL
ncbi:MAG: hypothetical protein ACK54F_07150, partial [Planctomycetia bacterium]